MCDKEATTDEHVPPRCIFPDKRDVGDDYRKDLITVPSCADHNLKKSDDDEFLMAFISGYVKNNPLAYLQTKTKLSRAVTNNAHLIDRVMKDVRSLEFKSDTGMVFPL